MWRKVLLFIAIALISHICGQLSSRIVNGYSARKGEIPYIVSLQKKRFHFCGGSILDEYHVLTAAHCVYTIKDLRHFKIQYGVIDLESNENLIPVEDITIHGEYENRPWYYDDIAILKLKDPMKFSKVAKPVNLPIFSDHSIDAESSSVLAGWGRVETRGPTSKRLKVVDLTVFSDKECEKLNKGASKQYHLCSGIHGGGKGQCSGDSGGPLIVNNVQVGIVSWSKKPCASPGNPGVFTRVSKYIHWINQNVD